MQLVGQEKLQATFIGLGQKSLIPQFIMLEGQPGSGRRAMTHFIAELLNAPLLELEELKIDNVRDMKIESQTVAENRVYLLANADGMTVQAENALLKLAEEPPKNFYIIMTVENRNNVLATIQSRAKTYTMEPYTIRQLEQFSKDELTLNVCSTPGQILEMNKIGVEEIYGFAQKVANNIDPISYINMFNITKHLDIDGKGGGHNVELFLNLLMLSFVEIGKQAPDKEKVLWAKRINIVRSHRKLYKNKSANKQAVVDIMLIKLKELGE